MTKRFWIICIIIAAALLVLTALGLSSLGLHERSLRAERQGQFTAVAEQIRVDVKAKLDEFLQAEQRRPYTDYQYAYVPETTNQTEALVRSPLADSLTHGLAFGHFQIDARGGIITPYAQANASELPLDPVLADYLNTLRTKVLSSLNGVDRASISHSPTEREEMPLSTYRAAVELYDAMPPAPMPKSEPSAPRGMQASSREMARGASRAQTYPVESLQEAKETQTVLRSRAAVERDIENVQRQTTQMPIGMTGAAASEMDQGTRFREIKAEDKRENAAETTVQIRMEPLVPLVVRDGADADSVFPGQIFLVRHVQIESLHLLQGFRLNETELAEQVQESAHRLLREGMAAELAQHENPAAAHTAILDFGFGELVLNLFERDPGWIAARIARLNLWMAAILSVVWLAVVLAMLALWRNLHEQLKLARQKDDFISAVSHELRTPLTSIRMYTEMLEKDWVKDNAKRREYYGTMRQESERLTRLIENVLDFSRLQRGKKQFEFKMGDINVCIREVVGTMRPYAERAGFVIETELSPIAPFAFDRDAVMQIMINLIDNSLKYAKDAADKRIIVRTQPQDRAAVIEVEDRGPGVPKSQQKKIFEAFYRCGDEATRQAVGTGLGLALVKRFTEAHHGTVEIVNAKPAGAIFRIRIAP